MHSLMPCYIKRIYSRHCQVIVITQKLIDTFDNATTKTIIIMTNNRKLYDNVKPQQSSSLTFTSIAVKAPKAIFNLSETKSKINVC